MFIERCFVFWCKRKFQKFLQIFFILAPDSRLDNIITIITIQLSRNFQFVFYVSSLSFSAAPGQFLPITSKILQKKFCKF
ncbi:unnamed protein product [Meloidogyne enterolobii]|uniref:Uncharacterized protein n=2 Tax=Meloidogyne enterolobii TaxID=390850 RepID=A0A6V7YAH5_MELEN|nr:unnamed protein product [Meloidogyne enterolobii]